jgi:hypothetical protein
VAYVPAWIYPDVYVAPAPVYYGHWYPQRYYARRDYGRHWDHGRDWDRRWR